MLIALASRRPFHPDDLVRSMLGPCSVSHCYFVCREDSLAYYHERGKPPRDDLPYWIPKAVFDRLMGAPIAFVKVYPDPETALTDLAVAWLEVYDGETEIDVDRELAIEGNWSNELEP